MAEWTTEFINNLPDSAFAYVEPGGEKDEEGKTVPRSLRHFPHHDDTGKLDLPHLRNALSRGPQSNVWPQGERHLEQHAESEGIGDRKALLDLGIAPMLPMKAAELDPDQADAWWTGKLPRRLLAIPFSGPIPGPAGKGRDLDMEFFDERTDIKPDWFDERPVDWHHSKDPTGVMTGVLIGKSRNLALDEDGWWVDLWLNAGEKRLSLIRKLEEKGAELFGSSYAYPNLVRRGKSGHIDVWPYMLQTLSTSPQNTHSVLRPAKAVLDVFDQADISVLPALRDVLTELDALHDLSAETASGWLTPAHDLSERAAKAGEEQSGAAPEQAVRLREQVETLLASVVDLRDWVRSKNVNQDEGTST